MVNIGIVVFNSTFRLSKNIVHSYIEHKSIESYT